MESIVASSVYESMSGSVYGSTHRKEEREENARNMWQCVDRSHLLGHLELLLGPPTDRTTDWLLVTLVQYLLIFQPRGRGKLSRRSEKGEIETGTIRRGDKQINRCDDTRAAATENIIGLFVAKDSGVISENSAKLAIFQFSLLSEVCLWKR